MILVDTNILIDILSENHEWFERSNRALIHWECENALAINPLIYAEVSVPFSSPQQADEIISPERFIRLQLPYSAAFLAGKAYANYKKNNGHKSSVLSDFYIGAHALIEKMPLLTRDIKIFKTYFPDLKLIHP